MEHNYEYNEFRGLVHKKYRSEAEFGRAIGWNRQRVNKIVNNEKIPTLDELELMAPALNMSIYDLVDYFLKKKSPNGQQKQGA